MSNDTLDRLMTTLAVHLHTFAVCRIDPGWRLRLGRMDQITIHYVLEGSGTLQLEEGGGAVFEPHSIILVPPGQAQSLAGPGEVLREARDQDNCVLLADGLIAFRAGEDSVPEDAAHAAIMESMVAQIDRLETEVDDWKQVVATRDEEIRRRDAILMTMAQRIPELEAPREPPQAPETVPDNSEGPSSPRSNTGGRQEGAQEPEERKPWWVRWFGG